MTTSILDTIKAMLGVETSQTAFDTDIIVGINTTFMTLHQLGVGPTTVFSISDKTKTWSDFLGTSTDIEAVKSYIYSKVKLTFDPPTSSYVLTAMDVQSKELEWRLAAQVEPEPIPEIPEEE